MAEIDHGVGVAEVCGFLETGERKGIACAGSGMGEVILAESVEGDGVIGVCGFFQEEEIDGSVEKEPEDEEDQAGEREEGDGTDFAGVGHGDSGRWWEKVGFKRFCWGLVEAVFVEVSTDEGAMCSVKGLDFSCGRYFGEAFGGCDLVLCSLQ